MSKCRSRFSCWRIRRARRRKGKRWKFNNTLWLVINTGKRFAKNFGKISDGKRVLTRGEKSHGKLPAMNLFYHTSQATYEPLLFPSLIFLSLSHVYFLLDQYSTSYRCDCPPLFHPSSLPSFILFTSTLR